MKLKSYTESKTQNLHFQICLSMHLLCMIYKNFSLKLKWKHLSNKSETKQ